MELYNHVCQIQSLYGGRNPFEYLFAGDEVVLADTGIAETRQKLVFPFMDRIGRCLPKVEDPRKLYGRYNFLRQQREVGFAPDPARMWGSLANHLTDSFRN